MTAMVTVPLGDLTSAQMRVAGGAVARVQRRHGPRDDGQDLVFRWVGAGNLRPLYRAAGRRGPGIGGRGNDRRRGQLPGRGVVPAGRHAVARSRTVPRGSSAARPDLVAAADGARIKISGCPNGCGQHHIATIGFQGSVRRIGSRAVPQYFVMVGGGAAGREATFARTAAKIPARRLPEAVERLIALYAREHPGKSAPEFFARLDLARVRRKWPIWSG